MSAGTIEQCLPTLIICYSNLKECVPQAAVTEKLHLGVWECTFEIYVSVCYHCKQLLPEGADSQHTTRCVQDSVCSRTENIGGICTAEKNIS